MDKYHLRQKLINSRYTNDTHMPYDGQFKYACCYKGLHCKLVNNQIKSKSNFPTFKEI